LPARAITLADRAGREWGKLGVTTNRESGSGTRARGGLRPCKHDFDHRTGPEFFPPAGLFGESWRRSVIAPGRGAQLDCGWELRLPALERGKDKGELFDATYQEAGDLGDRVPVVRDAARGGGWARRAAGSRALRGS